MLPCGSNVQQKKKNSMINDGYFNKNIAETKCARRETKVKDIKLLVN